MTTRTQDRRARRDGAPRGPRAARVAPGARTKALDFQTGGDVAKTEQEDEVVSYGPDGEAGIGTLLGAFEKAGVVDLPERNRSG